MMSESVTVTVQDGRTGAPGKSEPGQTSLVGGLNLNADYFRTVPGIIKIVQLVCGIICMGCGSPGYGAGHWFLLVVVTAFIMTMLWTLAYLFSLREALKIPINWLLTEFINTVIYAVLYFTAFIVELTGSYYVSQIIAGVFGIINTLAYLAGAYFLYLEHKSSQQ